MTRCRVVSSSRGDAEAAVRHYERALELRPDYLEALSNLGVLVRAQGDTARARQLFDRAYRLAPSHDVVRENLASLLTALGAQVGPCTSPSHVACWQGLKRARVESLSRAGDGEWEPRGRRGVS